MEDKDITKYCLLMEEIKRRTSTVETLHSMLGSVMYKATTIEAMGFAN